MARRRIGPTHAEVKARALQDPEVRREYEALVLADRIAELRQQRGLTQEQLAKACGLKQPNIARIESGRAIPDWKTLWRVAEALGLRVRIDFEPYEEAPRPLYSA